ncbi:LRR domain containing protein, partial [Trema orientale]
RTYTLALLLPFLSELVTTDFSYSLLPTPKALSSPPLSKLKNLCIVGIDKLSDKDVWEIEWRFLESLRLLRLDCLPKLTTLPPPVLQIINLQELHIWRCGMKNIDGIEALQYLEKLVIRVCPNLESLPRGISSLKNLTTLEIEDCATLIQRCNKKTGADWDKIAHIPKVHLGPISGR